VGRGTERGLEQASGALVRCAAYIEPGVERLVDTGTDRYEVVQKIERAGEVARAMDPRDRQAP
jgi:hypothetical protein